MSFRIRFAGLALGCAVLASLPAAAQFAPHEPGGGRDRDTESFYYQGVPGNPPRPDAGFPLDFSGRVDESANEFLLNAANCHSHDSGVADVPFHSDMQCHDHPANTPGVVPAR